MSRRVSMSRRIGPVALAVGIAALVVTPSIAATKPARSPGHTLAPGSREWPIDKELLRFTPTADPIWRRSPTDGIAFGDSLLRIARATGDRTLRAAVHVWRGRKYANDYQVHEGMADLDTAWTLASALRDSAGLARVLAARGHGLQVVGDQVPSLRTFKALVPLARAAGLPGLEGFAHRGIGFITKERGQYAEAERHLGTAIRLIPSNRFENLHARFLLSEVKTRTGRHDEARTEYLALVGEGRQRGEPWIVAGCLNDLGILEYEGGDMAMADRYWAYAVGVFDSTENPSSARSAMTNRANALRNLGRTAEARALLQRVIDESSRDNDARSLIAAHGELAMLYERIGRAAQAETLFRRVRSTAAAEDAVQEEGSSIELGVLLCAMGRPREAEALLDSLLAPPRRARLTRDNLSATLGVRSRAIRLQGRPREALANAREAEFQARSDREIGTFALDGAMELADCYRDLGMADSAVVVLRRAAARWERWRLAISDLEWRERSGSGLAGLFADYGIALLDPRRQVSAARRTREAFDALQAFQARTLEERMHGRGLSGNAMRHRITADSLRRGVLRDGELLVDVVATPDTTFAFLVSRGGLEVRLLPGARRLERLHADWQQAMIGGAEPAVVAAGLRRLSAEIITPIAGPLAASRRIVFTGGGPVALWPIAALTLPGESVPLGATREVSTAPSATLLATLRTARPAPSADRERLLAVGRTTDARGRELPGAERELQSLAREYAGVEVRLSRGDRSVSELTADLTRWSLLHFAAHAEAEAGSPWRSGFLLGRGGGDEAYLRASSVAGMRLRARLAVLSGCQSAGATTLAGEGALGLASAFLCSGTASVVATLWPVEDRVAQQFMAPFYAALARGSTVAGAVAEAQRHLRSRSETADPRDWAAFVAAGEGGTRVRLTAARSLTPGPGDRLNP